MEIAFVKAHSTNTRPVESTLPGNMGLSEKLDSQTRHAMRRSA